MSIIKPNNNTISAITALPAAISTGKVLQVVSVTKTDTQVTSTAVFVDVSGLSLSITPSSSSNKVFLVSIQRTKLESGQENKKINSICKFDFVDYVKSKNIDQKKEDSILELIGIDYLKNKSDYEINLMFSNNAYISLSTETIEVSLEDQNEIK